MKLVTLKFSLSLVVALIILSAPTAKAQWDSGGGIQQFSHGTGDQPRIRGLNTAQLEFIEGQLAATGSPMVLSFRRIMVLVIFKMLTYGTTPAVICSAWKTNWFE